MLFRSLVCPVTAEGVRERDVYLPDNHSGWYDYYSGQYHSGGQTLHVAAPLEHLPLIAKDTNGAYRWFYLGQLGSLQPSELLKYGVLVFLAGFLSKRVKQEKINDM